MILYDPNNPSSQYENRKKLFESLIEKAQKAKAEENKTSTPRSVPSKTLKSDGDADHYNNKNNNGKDVNNGHGNSTNSNDDKNNKNGNNKNDDQQSLRNPNGYVYEPNKNFGSTNLDCCNIDSVQLILPQNDSCSQNTAKLIIPINSEKFSSISISDFSNIQLSSSISFVLKELQYLVEKYNL